MIGASMLRRMGTSLPRVGGVKVLRRGMADEAGDANKLLLNFLVPNESIKKEARVDMIQIPASGGEMGILPHHVQTVAQMKPGVVTVTDEGTSERYFVSSGYTFVHKDRTDVCASEAVKLEDVDAEAVRQGLADCQIAMTSAGTEEEKAVAQIERLPPPARLQRQMKLQQMAEQFPMREWAFAAATGRTVAVLYCFSAIHK